MRTPPLSPAEASLNLPLPRPPAWIWLFTTQIGPGNCLAAASASSGFSTGTPFEICLPSAFSRALLLYSLIFIGQTLPKPWFGGFQRPTLVLLLAYHIPHEL